AASGRDQFGQLMLVQPAITWSTSGGTINNAGLFTAQSAPGGPFTVTATSRAISGTASVMVTPVNAAPTVATAPSATPNPAPGAPPPLRARGAEEGGDPALPYTGRTPGTPPAAVTFSANGTNAARTSVATFTRAGTYNLQVTIRDAGSLTPTAPLAVTVSAT